MKIGKLQLNKKRIFLFFLGILVVFFIFYFACFDSKFLEKNSFSTTFYDRNNTPLRTLLSKDEKYSQKCFISEVSPHFLRAIVLVEDRKYYSHKGINISSLFRALFQNVKKNKIISGASTVTMQLAKLLAKNRKRNIWNKIGEIFYALKIELHLSKTAILQEYINRLPFSNMVYGVKEAAWFYFNKNPAQLSLNQAIYLALIPKSPSVYNPKKHEKNLQKRWVVVLEEFYKNKYISPDEYLRAKKEGIEFAMDAYPFSAPHFIEFIKKKYPDSVKSMKVLTTLDIKIQKIITGLVAEYLNRLKNLNVKSAAVVVIDNYTHEVVGFLGSPGYFQRDINGFVNFATSLRQPGSTLKPFVYGIALEEDYTASAILPDIKFPSKGGFFPKNHDGREHGPVRLRIALACSYNIPAFYLAMKLTPLKILEKLHLAGFNYLGGKSGFYGETIALGSGEVKLLDLVIAYSSLANKGIIYKPVFLQGWPVQQKRLFTVETAFLLFDILSDPAARFASFGYDSSMNLPFPLAIKTGTSKGYRDKWAIGVNSLYTVGVWMGNPDGENMRDLSNTGNATALLRDIFLAVQKDWTRGGIKVPANIVQRTICPVSGCLISPYCPDSVEEYFVRNKEPVTKCDYHYFQKGKVRIRYPEIFKKWAVKNRLSENIAIKSEAVKRISFPQPGDFFYISDAIPLSSQEINFEVMGFMKGDIIKYYLNGKLYQTLSFPDSPRWTLAKGDYAFTVKHNNIKIDTIKFLVR